jgi:hypothetical protein
LGAVSEPMNWWLLKWLFSRGRHEGEIMKHRKKESGYQRSILKIQK